ncbi:hypothetical protein [Rhodococcus sp. 077-4]|uniref:hypothetical protein n=1 Tax=Rhodococcus sp. 077-4 TaxID=2789271 RepID=UPI0039F4F933
MIVVPSISTPLAEVIPSLSHSHGRDTDMMLSVDESAGADIVVRVTGPIGDSDVPVLAETLGEAAERGRALILDLSSVVAAAAGIHSVLDATAIRLGRWNQQLAVVLSPALQGVRAQLVPNRVDVRPSLDAPMVAPATDAL